MASTIAVLEPMHAQQAAGPRPPAGRSVFDGVPPDRTDAAHAGLPRRRFPAGSILIAQGDTAHEFYVVEEGVADVFVADADGAEHRVGSVHAGGTLGEMSLFTGQPATGTVRAATEVEVIVVGADEFERIAAEYPVVYRNLGAILSERLARTNRLAARHAPGHVVHLRDVGGPPLLAWALASSVAWHTRGRTLLLVVGERLPDELTSLLGGEPAGAVMRRDGAHLATCEPEAMAATVHALSGSDYDIVVVLHRGAERRLPDAGELDLGALVALPQFSDLELESLRRGLLPNRKGAGRELGRVARKLCGLRVGLALGAGSVRGFAHFGVLRAFERLGLEADFVAGTSIGATVGAMHAKGADIETGIDTIARSGAHLVRYGVPRKGLLSNRGVSRFIHSELGDIRIEDLPVPLALVAADILTQQEVVFRRGLLWQAVVASLSIPGVYPALWIGEHLVVDGGVLNPVPVSVAAQMGADVVLAVRLVGESTPHVEVESVVAKGAPPSAINVIMRSIELMQGRIGSEVAGTRTITITPGLVDLPANKLRSFAEGPRFVDVGETAVEEALPRIEAALPWVRPE